MYVSSLSYCADLEPENPLVCAVIEPILWSILAPNRMERLCSHTEPYTWSLFGERRVEESSPSSISGCLIGAIPLRRLAQ